MVYKLTMFGLHCLTGIDAKTKKYSLKSLVISFSIISKTEENWIFTQNAQEYAQLPVRHNEDQINRSVDLVIARFI